MDILVDTMPDIEKARRQVIHIRNEAYFVDIVVDIVVDILASRQVRFEVRQQR